MFGRISFLGASAALMLASACSGDGGSGSKNSAFSPRGGVGTDTGGVPGMTQTTGAGGSIQPTPGLGGTPGSPARRRSAMGALRSEACRAATEARLRVMRVPVGYRVTAQQVRAEPPEEARSAQRAVAAVPRRWATRPPCRPRATRGRTRCRPTRAAKRTARTSPTQRFTTRRTLQRPSPSSPSSPGSHRRSPRSRTGGRSSRPTASSR